jgi:hypothetical protein
MIHKNVIDAIYKKFRHRPSSPDELNIPLLFESLHEDAQVEVDEKHLVIGKLEHCSPFRKIPIHHIHAIVGFEEMVAIVLHSSIVFIKKDDGSAYVHLKEISQNFFERMACAISSNVAM